MVRLNSDWLGIAEGSLIGIKTTDLRSDDLKSKIKVLFAPDEINTIESVSSTKDHLLVSILRNVTGKILYYSLKDTELGKEWVPDEITLPEFGSVGVLTVNHKGNNLMVWFSDFLTPTKLFYFSDPSAEPKEIKSLLRNLTQVVSKLTSTTPYPKTAPAFLILLSRPKISHSMEPTQPCSMVTADSGLRRRHGTPVRPGICG